MADEEKRNDTEEMALAVINGLGQDVAIERINTFIKAVSLLGGPTATMFSGVFRLVLGDISNKRKFERIAKLFDWVFGDVENLKKQINEEFVRKDSFEDLLEETIKRAATQPNKEMGKILTTFFKDMVTISDILDAEQIQAMFFQLYDENERTTQQEKIDILKKAAKGIFNPDFNEEQKRVFIAHLRELQPGHIQILRRLVKARQNPPTEGVDFLPGDVVPKKKTHAEPGEGYVHQDYILEGAEQAPIQHLRTLQFMTYIEDPVAQYPNCWRASNYAEELLQFLGELEA